ncbi:hypothetical protein FHS01_004039 [Longimicrobium terrae]|uniref:Uncharacterized protein n=1 Tax=Longimicrobium terrae TaxID=1639882 RepID=A0A841H2H2_9BACT|nr:hypothetical protein [Longimicrobium terrae]MBB6072227.1 hypothetical protein [Longimicrobium terrae]
MKFRLIYAAGLMALIALASCLPAPAGRGVMGPAIGPTKRDSVGGTRQVLYGLTRVVDLQARSTGELPVTLESTTQPIVAELMFDPWGQAVRYIPRGKQFEVRSSGSDRIFETSDDVIALGQIGRNQPCVIRDEFRTWTGAGYEPPCGPSAIIVLLQCPQLTSPSSRDDEAPASSRDSVQLMGLRLVRIARGIDAAGRDLGGLPLTLRAVASASALNMDEIGDIWRRPLRYRPNNRDYEVRSAGPDGNHDTPDDLVVEGHLGQVVPCLFVTEGRVVACSELPPPCLDG